MIKQKIVIPYRLGEPGEVFRGRIDEEGFMLVTLKETFQETCLRVLRRK